MAAAVGRPRRSEGTIQGGGGGKAKASRMSSLPSKLIEATTGFEPVIRVLQTLALPLGHVARELPVRPLIIDQRMLIVRLQTAISIRRSSIQERAMGFEPTTFSLARRRSTTELHPHEMACSSGREVPRPRIELGTPRFSVACSTN
jgi:hypothetical protein